MPMTTTQIAIRNDTIAQVRRTHDTMYERAAGVARVLQSCEPELAAITHQYAREVEDAYRRFQAAMIDWRPGLVPDVSHSGATA